MMESRNSISTLVVLAAYQLLKQYQYVNVNEFSDDLNDLQIQAGYTLLTFFLTVA